MWILLDFKVAYRDNGCDVEAEDLFYVRNENTGGTKWINAYEYGRMKAHGLIKEKKGIFQ